MLCDSLDGRKVWERIDTGIYMAVSLCYLPETTITLLIGYTPTQNKKFKIWGEKRKTSWAGTEVRGEVSLGRHVFDFSVESNVRW